ncbi:hypothetical protein Z043_102323 [Scleropages formosus]|uniref:Uncharacterized protein n=1 Tax=Scleropages formosus TaxID=113540 RepID=A0A0P7VPW9_SCLFO|nr:hypothetical protein Z043_102323 [Scleropages formosus]
MPLRVFSYPLPETRFFQAGSRVFKFKIRNGSNARGCEITDEQVSQEIEVRVTGPDVLPIDRSVCHSKRSRREQPLEGSPVQLSLWEKTVLEGLEMDGEPHFWPSRPETMASDRAVDGKEAREAQGEQGEPATEAQEGQPHTPKRSTPTGDHTSVFIRWACKMFPLSLFSSHKKK